MFTSGFRFRLAQARWAVLVLIMLLAISAVRGVAAQPVPPAAGESAEEATVFLQQYRLPDAVVPAGYSHGYDVAWINATQAFDYALGEFADPRPAEEILGELEASGRVVQLLSLYTGEGEGAADLWYTISLFRTPEGAAQALQNPRLAETVLSNDRVAGVELAGLGQGMAAYKVEKLDAEGGVRKRNDLVLWQRGRVVFALAANGEPAAVEALLPSLPVVAVQAAAQLAARPEPPATFGPPVEYMPSGMGMLQLLGSLHQRQLPDDAFVGLGLDVEDSTSVPELMHETPVAEAPISDIGVFKERALRAERLIVGLSKSFKTPTEAGAPAASAYPVINTGYYVYADAVGAAEGIGATLAEVALKLYQENSDLPSAPSVSEIPSPIAVGEQTRAFRTSWAVGDQPIETTSVRWRRGAVELWVDVSVAAGQDAAALVSDAVGKLDAAYTAAPLPLDPLGPALPADQFPSDRQTGPPSSAPSIRP